MNNTIQSIDEKIFLTLNNNHSIFFDSLMLWASDLFVLVPLILIISYFAFKHYKNKGVYHPFASAFLLVFVLTFSYIVCVDFLPHLVSFFYDRTKPCLNPNIASMVRLVGEECGTDNANDFLAIRPCLMFCFVYFVLSMFKSEFPLFKLFIIIWAIIVAYSRIYLGIHYPLNVFVGIIFGILLGYLFSKFYFYLKNQVLNFT